MKAVFSLVSHYFFGTPLNRGFTLGGLAVLALAFVILTTQAQSGGILWLVAVGLIALFIGGGLMPLTFGRMARSHVIGIVPLGRLKLLLSAFITVLLVSIPVAVIAPFAFAAGISGSATDLVKHREMLMLSIHLAELLFVSAFLFAGWMYLALWFVTSQRNLVGFSKGLLVVVIVVFAPARDIQNLNVSLGWTSLQIAIPWIVFGLGFLLWPRLKGALARNPARFAGMQRAAAENVSGREFDLMLGTASPWRLIMMLALPLILATRFVGDIPAVWLFFLALISAVTGAMAGDAASRSRALWLRGDWSREALFYRVEQSFWRHNGYVLGSLLLVMVGIGSYVGLPTATLGAGLPLLVLGTVMSTYLGLMITRGLHLIEAVIGVTIMLGLMAVAVLIVRKDANIGVVVGLEALLAVVAVVLRGAALRRWRQLDWSQCRPDKVLPARAAR